MSCGKQARKVATFEVAWLLSSRSSFTFNGGTKCVADNDNTIYTNHDKIINLFPFVIRHIRSSTLSDVD